MGKICVRVAAALLCASLGVVLAPGCTIRIGSGAGEDGQSSPTDDSTDPDGTHTAGGEALSPEEQAAVEALQNADPADIQLGTAMAAYAAVGTASLVESQILDPAAIDEPTIEQL